MKSCDGARPDLAYGQTSEVFGDFGSLAGDFPLASRLTDSGRLGQTAGRWYNATSVVKMFEERPEEKPLWT